MEAKRPTAAAAARDTAPGKTVLLFFPLSPTLPLLI